MANRTSGLGSIPGTRIFEGGDDVRGRHKREPCSRCGRSRQVNRHRVNKDGLCPDCRYSDPKVWVPSEHAIWDGEEEDHAHAS